MYGLCMNKKKFIYTCVSLNVLFIFGQIYKQTQYTRLLYMKQLYEQSLEEKKQTITQLTHHLYCAKDPSAIKLFAEKELNMKPLHLKHINRIPSA